MEITDFNYKNIQIKESKNAEVVIVGAGPVGLWTAVQIKLRDPKLHVDIVEKRLKYERNHVLHLSKNSFKKCPSDPRIQAIVNEFLQTPYLRTITIEEKLSALATDLAIGIRKGVEFSSQESILTEYPKAKIVIGADGAHSMIRKTVFQEEMGIQKNCQFVMEVKYDAEGQAKPLRLVRTAYPTWKVLSTIIQEHIGSEKEGKTPITIRMFIGPEEYKKMQGANAKNPYTLESEELDERTRNRLKIWLAIREREGERRILGSEKITVTPLGIYVSKEVVKKTDNVFWCLVGDAASGVPFFRSLNKGLLEGTELSKRVVKALDTKNLEGLEKDYSDYAKWIARREIVLARIKSFFINIGCWFVKLSAYVPWQVNYWSKKDIQMLLERA